MRKKKAQAGSIATFLLLMAVFILFYVLLIPPPEREELLGTREPGELDGSLTSGISDGELLLSAFPGELSPLKEGEVVRELSPISLFSKTGKEIIDLSGLISLKARFFNTDTRSLFFSVDDPGSVENANLVFFVNQGKGRLKIELNNIEVFESELRQDSVPIALPVQFLKESNNLKFTLKSKIFENEYELSDVKVSLSQKLEKKTASRTFSVTSGEKKGLERATLSYFVDCLSIRDTGTITIFMNDRLLDSDFVSCNLGVRTLDIPLNRVRTGINTLEFTIDKGDYIIDDPLIVLELFERDFPVYNFDIDDITYRSLFNNCYDSCVFDCDFVCDGSSSCLDECIGECSDECNTAEAILLMRFAEGERKAAAITINEFQLNMDTFALFFEANIKGFLRRGSNSIKIIPKTEFEVENLQVIAG